MRRIQAVLLIAAAIPAWAAQPVRARHGMVVSRERHATHAGLQVLQSGGNAVDAAVAAAATLGVTEPYVAAIGGGGFFVYYDAKTHHVHTIDGRETAPRAARADMYLDAVGNPVRDRSLYGYLAAGVPGTVMGLDHALTQYGRLGRAQVMAPAIALARDGFVPYFFDAYSSPRTVPGIPEAR